MQWPEERDKGSFGVKRRGSVVECRLVEKIVSRRNFRAAQAINRGRLEEFNRRRKADGERACLRNRTRSVDPCVKTQCVS
jgi:hypothetical protein